MNLSRILEEIKTLQPFADENVEQGPVETMGGRRGRKNQAVERLKTLKQEYRQGLLDTAIFIVVTGEKREAFTSLATSKFGCFEANPNALYENLATRLEPAFKQSRESVPNLFDILGRHLEDQAQMLGIIAYPQLIFRSEYQVTVDGRAGLVDLIRRAINDQVGSEMVGIQAAYDITPVAVAANHGARTTPIILSTDNVKLALDLEKTLGRLKPKAKFLVVSGKGTKELKAVPGVVMVKDPSEEEVEKVLKEISGATKR